MSNSSSRTAPRFGPSQQVVARWPANNPRQDWAEWKDLLTAAGIRDARPHDARHTAATLLLEQGVDIRVVQELLGHSTLAVTKRYTHVTSKLSRDTADRIGKALWA